MRADTIAPGDVLTDPATGSLVYTVLDVLAPDHPTHRLATDEPHVTILVRYAVDGGTDTRVFDPEQDVPLTRVRPINPSACPSCQGRGCYACEPPDETGAGISGLTPER